MTSRRDGDDAEPVTNADGEVRGQLARAGQAVITDLDEDQRWTREEVRARLFGGEPPTQKPETLVDGRYRIDAAIGRGGMGTVYRAFDTSRRRALALKRLRRRGSADEQRFRREFHTLASLRHRGIVEAYDYGIDKHGPYYTMELLSGADLREVGSEDLRSCCQLLRQIASVLAFLHARSLVHRDVTPRNVRVSEDGTAKLIDFGLLAEAGAVGQISGTLPFIAPEAWHGCPLDRRADLFALGALAYWLLTGRHAFQPRSPDELPELWKQPPQPPSALRAEVPAAMNQLVLGLLRTDPLARPASAAEVVDRLGAIAGLPQTSELDAGYGYLQSAALVGRQRQLEKLGAFLQEAREGRGSAVLLEGPSGVGKTRLLRELYLNGQLEGALVVSAASGDAAQAYGLMRAIAKTLLLAAPRDAEQAARTHAAVLGRIVPSLLTRVGPLQLEPLTGDPVEDQLRLEAALHAWLLDVAQCRPLLLLVDDVQRSDEASAFALASLARTARRHPLMLAVALRTDDPAHAPAALDDLRRICTRLPLSGLDLEGVAALIRALFGNIPHAAELARAIHQTSGGSPLHCLEIARHLVQERTVHYADGIWVSPTELSSAQVEQAVPRGITEAMDQRVEQLPEGARSLARVLSVHGGPFSPDTARELAHPHDADEVRAVLQHLVANEFLWSDGESYRFSHDGLREALVRGINDGEHERLHLRVAEVLAPQGQVLSDNEAAVGWHLLRGGDELRGARMLEHAARRIYREQSLRDAIAPLKAALQAYERAEVMPRSRLELLQMLVVAGSMVDRECALRHADVAIERACHYAGLDLAKKLRRFVGRYAAFALGLLWAALRRFATPHRRRGPPAADALLYAIMIGNTASICFAHIGAYDKLRVLIDRLWPLALRRIRSLYGAHRMLRATLQLPQGQYDDARQGCVHALHSLHKGGFSRLSTYHFRLAQAAVRTTLAWIAVMDQEPSYEDEVAKVEGLSLPSFAFSCLVLRLVYHRGRGEEKRALELEERAEHARLQARSLWIWEYQLWAQSAVSYGLTRDMTGLRRCIAQLEPVSRSSILAARARELAIGEYRRERGDLDAALVIFERLERQDLLLPERQRLKPAFAETLLCAEAYERAATCAREGIELTALPGCELKTVQLRCEATLARADAALGLHQAAIARLDQAICSADDLSSPSIIGLLHEARALVARQCDDDGAFSDHSAAAERWFSPTQNPSLIARAKHLSATRR